MKILESKFVQGFIKMANDGYLQGWHERNGGNLSYRLKPEEVEMIRPRLNAPGEWIPIGVEVPGLAGEFFLVTGSGKYFRNIIVDPEVCLAIIELDETGTNYRIRWGLVEGGRPTSELPTHLMNHEVKKKLTYSPKSVVSCMRLGKLGNYWNQTETFEALQIYIDMNFEGLRDDILSMIAGETVPVNTRSFTNDMTTFRTEDDVLTLLIHLGYLGYRYADKTVFIPNEEIRSEYVSAIAVSDWGEVSKALKNSADTLQAIWQGREEQVAEGIRQAHFETSHLQYNDENALSYTISLALYAARNFYTVHRELSGGKGFADIVYVPRKRFLDKPALVVELKWDKNAEGAIQQIKEKEYCRSLEEYKGNLLLVGINYDKKTQVHTCKIEQYRKEESI